MIKTQPKEGGYYFFFAPKKNRSEEKNMHTELKVFRRWRRIRRRLGGKANKKKMGLGVKIPTVWVNLIVKGPVTRSRAWRSKRFLDRGMSGPESVCSKGNSGRPEISLRVDNRLRMSKRKGRMGRVLCNVNVRRGGRG